MTSSGFSWLHAEQRVAAGPHSPRWLRGNNSARNRAGSQLILRRVRIAQCERPSKATAVSVKPLRNLVAPGPAMGFAQSSLAPNTKSGALRAVNQRAPTDSGTTNTRRLIAIGFHESGADVGGRALAHLKIRPILYLKLGLGGPGGIRTHDSRIKSPELYR